MLASKIVAGFGAKAGICGWIVALFLSPGIAPAAVRAQRASVSTLVPGETLRYLLEYRSSIHVQSAGPVYTPASAHRLDISLEARIRLDVLGVRIDSKQDRLTRLRVSYESCDASVHSDAYDPGAKTLQQHYRDLQGRSFEFTIDGQGRIRDLAGLDRLEPDERAQNAIRQWLSTLTLPLSLWKPGLKPGKRWSRELPLAGAPLAGLAWRTQSTYRDDEPCPVPVSSRAESMRQRCAVITTHLETVQHSTHGDSTPPSYRRQGLKTSGRWTARGESLSYVSLSSGLVESSTATETDAMDLTITSTFSGSRLHYAGQAQSRSQIALIAVTFPGRHSGDVLPNSPR